MSQIHFPRVKCPKNNCPARNFSIILPSNRVLVHLAFNFFVLSRRPTSFSPGVARNRKSSSEKLFPKEKKEPENGFPYSWSEVISISRVPLPVPGSKILRPLLTSLRQDNADFGRKGALRPRSGIRAPNSHVLRPATVALSNVEKAMLQLRRDRQMKG